MPEQPLYLCPKCGTQLDRVIQVRVADWGVPEMPGDGHGAGTPAGAEGAVPC